MRRPPQLIVSEKPDRTDSAGEEEREGGLFVRGQMKEGGFVCVLQVGRGWHCELVPMFDDRTGEGGKGVVEGGGLRVRH